VQGTAEHKSFERAQLDKMLDGALAGIAQLIELQKQVLKDA
jgi:ribonuclease PH